MFLVLITNKLDGSVRISYFAASSPLFFTFFTLIMASFGSRGGKITSETKVLQCFHVTFAGNQYWFGLRKPPCQFLFGVCPCLQLFGNTSYSLYSNHGGGGGGRGQLNNGEQQIATPSTTSTSESPGSSPSPTSQDHHQQQYHLSEISLVFSGSNGSSKKKSKKSDHHAVVVPALALEMPD